MEYLEMSILLDFYGKVLTDKQRDAMEQYYNNDLSLAEIAENQGITRQGVRDSIKRGETVLTDLENKVGYAARYRKMHQGLDAVRKLALEIAGQNAATSYNIAQITLCADEIVNIVNKLDE